MLLHEALGEHFRAFETSRLASGTKNGEAPLGELVGDAERERQLGTHDRQIDLEIAGEVGQLLHLVRGDRHQVGHLLDSGVAGGAVEIGDSRALSELPAQGVLAAAAADDQNFHVSPKWTPHRGRRKVLEPL